MALDYYYYFVEQKWEKLEKEARTFNFMKAIKNYQSIKEKKGTRKISQMFFLYIQERSFLQSLD